MKILQCDPDSSLEIIKQLKSGNLVIVYDEDTNSSNIVESDLVLPNE